MENMSKNSQLWRTSFCGVKYIVYDNTTGRMQKQRPGYSPTSEKNRDKIHEITVFKTQDIR